MAPGSRPGGGHSPLPGTTQGNDGWCWWSRYGSGRGRRSYLEGGTGVRGSICYDRLQVNAIRSASTSNVPRRMITSTKARGCRMAPSYWRVPVRYLFHPAMRPHL